jgi:hypothetical protein
LQLKVLTNMVPVERWAFPMAVGVTGAEAGAPPTNFLDVVAVEAIRKVTDGAH